jgi:2-polyprenyl-3-methyl-5-hydroxy-6-metoxy-1,4-benzoquinol methylase
LSETFIDKIGLHQAIFSLNPMIRWFRRSLRSIYPLRSTYHFLLAALDRMRGSKRVLHAHLNQNFEKADPWNYAGSPIQSERFDSALRLLDSARKGRSYETAFEVGCAEGIFTRMLVSRCQSLLSVDIVRAALARATERCAGLGVTFSYWDLSSSPVPVHPDLLVMMDVLELYFRPEDVRTARDKLVGALEPGGHLLLGGSRQDLLFETAWWGKYMLRGGKRVAEFFFEHSDLELVAMETGEIYVNAIFRKSTESPAEKPLNEKAMI